MPDPAHLEFGKLSSPYSRHAHFFGYPREDGHKGFLDLLKIGLSIAPKSL
jgi:hypothetical protein